MTTLDIGRIGLSKRGFVPLCYRAGLTFFEWFWGQTREPIDSECWEWQRDRYPTGYGHVHVPGTGRDYAHRVAWVLTNGAVPSGLWVLHTCDNPPCVRPSHLYVGTPLDNAQDREARGRSRAAKQTHCLNGHLLAGGNIYAPRRGPRERKCRACSNAAGRLYYHRHWAAQRAKDKARYWQRRAMALAAR